MILLFASASAHVPFDRGDFTITEIHAGPTGEGGQWFEVRNDSGSSQNLVEQVFTEGDGSSKQLTLTLIVRAGEYAVLAHPDSTVSADALLTDDFDIEALADSLTHSDLSGTIDTVAWDETWAVETTRAHAVNPIAVGNEAANDLPGNWCAAEPTPGAANGWCPGSETDDDGDGFSEQAGDCDDTDPAIGPGAVDDGDAINNDADCDGVRDDGVTDDDGDGWSEVDGDCDDEDDGRFPGALEQADGLDQDCDGVVDELDGDADGADSTADCDDADPGRYPGASEAPCDGVDQDCDGADDCPEDTGETGLSDTADSAARDSAEPDSAPEDDSTGAPHGCACSSSTPATTGLTLALGLVFTNLRRPRGVFRSPTR